MSALALSYPEDIASLQSSSTSCPYKSSAPTSKMIPIFGGVGVIQGPTYDKTPQILVLYTFMIGGFYINRYLLLKEISEM